MLERSMQKDFLCLPLSLALTLSLTRTHSLSLSHTHTHSLSLSLSASFLEGDQNLPCSSGALALLMIEVGFCCIFYCLYFVKIHIKHINLQKKTPFGSTASTQGRFTFVSHSMLCFPSIPFAHYLKCHGFSVTQGLVKNPGRFGMSNTP